MYLNKVKDKIEAAKTSVPLESKDFDWMEGFNAGLDWALRILNGDKSAS